MVVYDGEGDRTGRTIQVPLLGGKPLKAGTAPRAPPVLLLLRRIGRTTMIFWDLENLKIDFGGGKGGFHLNFFGRVERNNRQK
jgi:hypothetical protein